MGTHHAINTAAEEANAATATTAAATYKPALPTTNPAFNSTSVKSHSFLRQFAQEPDRSHATQQNTIAIIDNTTASHASLQPCSRPSGLLLRRLA